MKIDIGTLNAAVTKKFLDAKNINSGFKKMGGEAVAQCMRGYSFFKSMLMNCFCDIVFDGFL